MVWKFVHILCRLNPRENVWETSFHARTRQWETGAELQISFWDRETYLIKCKN